MDDPATAKIDYQELRLNKASLSKEWRTEPIGKNKTKVREVKGKLENETI